MAKPKMALRLAALGSAWYGGLSQGGRRIAMALLATCSAGLAIVVILQRPEPRNASRATCERRVALTAFDGPFWRCEASARRSQPDSVVWN